MRDFLLLLSAYPAAAAAESCACNPATRAVTATISAGSDEADTQINGGPGTDTACYDAGIDPGPSAVETLIGA